MLWFEKVIVSISIGYLVLLRFFKESLQCVLDNLAPVVESWIPQHSHQIQHSFLF